MKVVLFKLVGGGQGAAFVVGPNFADAARAVEGGPGEVELYGLAFG